jgi:hypothetical protein
MTGYSRFGEKPAIRSNAPRKRRALIALKAAVAVFWSTVYVMTHVALVLAVFFNPRLPANRQLFGSVQTESGCLLLMLFILDFIGLMAFSYLVMVTTLPKK